MSSICFSFFNISSATVTVETTSTDVMHQSEGFHSAHELTGSRVSSGEVDTCVGIHPNFSAGNQVG